MPSCKMPVQSSVVRYKFPERYRSGHNGTDSKSVGGKPHVGSNPTLSAIFPACNKSPQNLIKDHWESESSWQSIGDEAR